MRRAKSAPMVAGRKARNHSRPSRTYGFGWVCSVSSSCSTDDSLGSPTDTRTSAAPCAPPLRSTDDPSACMDAVSHGSSSARLSSPTPRTRLPMARATTRRTSGFGSVSAFFSGEMSCGRYGTMSCGSATSVHMLPAKHSAPHQ